MSGQVIRYQKDSVPPAAGTVNVWTRELLRVGDVLPTRADAVPECAIVLVPVDPLAVQLVSPDSKPPFCSGLGTDVTMATSSYSV